MGYSKYICASCGNSFDTRDEAASHNCPKRLMGKPVYYRCGVLWDLTTDTPVNTQVDKPAPKRHTVLDTVKFTAVLIATALIAFGVWYLMR